MLSCLLLALATADNLVLCMAFEHNEPRSLFPQEIDGKALMLLRSDMIMKYMGLKLGPALKLCHHIERLKQGKL